MIDTVCRQKFQLIFDLIGKLLIKLKLSPNKITIIALGLGLSSGISLGFHNEILGFLFMVLSGIFDILDGTVARLTGKSSKIGAFLDLVFDRIVEGAIIIGFYFLRPEFSLIYLLFFVGAMFNFTTFMLAGILFKNEGKKSIHYDVGFVERTETFIAFGLMMIFPDYLNIILGIFNILMILTGMERFRRIVKYEMRGN